MADNVAEKVGDLKIDGEEKAWTTLWFPFYERNSSLKGFLMISSTVFRVSKRVGFIFSRRFKSGVRGFFFELKM